MSKFNLRKRPRVCYYEPEEPGFDEYVFCTECRDYVYEYCSIHGPLLVIPDDKVPVKTGYPPIVPRAALTIPRVFLHLAKSNIPEAGIGVFSTLTLPCGVRFGPYRGTNVSTPGDSYYGWQIYDKNHKPSHIVDASDDNNSNWMRYVNCSRHISEQNLLAYQYRGQLYYRTIKIIPRFSELLVFYGSEFANLLGVDLRTYTKACACSHCQTRQPTRTEPTKRKNLQSQNEETSKAEEKTNVKIQHGKNITTESPIEKSTETSTDGDLQSNNNTLAVPTLKHVTSDVSSGKTDINLNLITFKCDKCRKSLNVKSDLEKHIRTHMLSETLNHVKSKDFLCKSCKNLFKTKSVLLEHMNNQHGIKHFSCSECDYKTVTKSNLIYRKRTHTSEKPYKCSYCDYACCNKIDLVKHQRTHTGEKPYKCSDCDYACNQISALVTHQRTHTGEKPYKCSDCDYACGRKDSLKIHQRTHTGEKPYKCSYCDYACSNKSALIKHQRTHTGEKPYKCSYCDHACSDKSALIKHQRTHTGEKPYKCSYCDYAFSRKHNLVTHQRTHTGEKPYKCSYCDYACNQKSHLVVHQRRHTGEQPYTCDICDFKSVSKKTLNQHLIKVHAGKNS